jgi:cystathionine beta-lyase
MVAELVYCVSSDDAIHALRGLRTVGIRMERHQQSTMRAAEWLARRPEVQRVVYPALPTDPGYELWKRDFTGASGLFGVVLNKASKSQVDAMLNSLELFGMGASFGGFESLAIPMNPKPFRSASRWKVDGPYLRLHVGLEDPQDLIEDLERGFARLREAE